MKKRILAVCAILLALALLAGCSPEGSESAGGASESSQSGASESAGGDAGGSQGGEPNEQGKTMNDHEIHIPQTGWTTLVPNDYKTAASEQGTVTRLDYASKDYVRGGGAITKTAYVYTPYGYDENADTRYNILYLMHGWGGRAGGRMAARLGSRGAAYYGGDDLPKPAVCIIQYTGYSDIGNDPPTYACVGTSDGIANYRTMQKRINAIKAAGTDAAIEVFQGLPHGFGLGQGTVAEGWLSRAVAFWENHMN